MSIRLDREALSRGFTWIALCLLTLGFSPKYRNRLRKFEALVADRESTRVTRRTIKGKCRSSRAMSKAGAKGVYTQVVEERVSGNEIKSKEGPSPRAEQQLEWDRLSTAMSVITATSAAALAIPGLAGPGTYWVISSCFCVALGLSLEGLMLVTYVSLVSAGAPDEIIGFLATGEAHVYSYILRLISPQMFAGIVLALPATFISYSSLFLLVGTFFMIIRGHPGATVESKVHSFSLLALIPLSFGALVLVFVVCVCEVVLWNHNRELEREAALRAKASGP